ncbi:MAG: NAD(P)H-hydrate dehydratase [Imperialibacter sp.]|uniref:NAD(P)H-hydrate dehydratase n=1 Tax=Imperialibacter sp. TaxID=2038411 RepID=UPI0032EF3668
MKILSPQQIREADAYTIENEPITSVDLMERASNAFVEEFKKHFFSDHVVWVFCGTGNNGGDGLAVARLLKDLKYEVKVWLAGSAEKGTEDFRVNLNRLTGAVSVAKASEIYAADIPDKLVIVDALFGSGLNRPVDGDYAKLIDFLNGIEARKVAIDIPSGLFCDQPQNGAIAFHSDITITFQAPKLAFLLPENYLYVGEWKSVDIGLSAQFMMELECSYYYQQVGDEDLRPPNRARFAHKGDAGRTLLIAGSKGKVGAAILSSKACMRAGAGLLTVHAPGCAVTPIHAAVPEAMVSEDSHHDYITQMPDGLSNFDCVAIGPGLGTHNVTVKAFESVLKIVSKPMVIDADGLNILSRNPGLLELVPANSILTPHPGEFRRLVGDWSNDYERLNKQIEFSKKHQLIMVLKGAYSSISTPGGEVYFNSTGNPGMATAGSGDVLTGIVAGLLSQAFSPTKSARLAVLLHGISGDLGAQSRGEYGLIASDVIDFLPAAFTKL